MPDKKNTSLYWDIGQVIIGIMIGIALALPFFLVSTNTMVDFIRDNAIGIVVLGSFTTAILLLFLTLRKLIIRWLFGITTKSAENLTDEALLIAEAVAQKDFKEAQDKGKKFALQIAALYGWMATRRAILSIIIVFGGLLAGVLGSALLIQQNKILEAQNRNLDLQLKTGLLSPILQEANRRVPLYSQITSIFSRIDAEVEAAINGSTAVKGNEGDDAEELDDSNRVSFSPVRLSDRLYSDITGLSLQLKPYLHFDSQRLDLSEVETITESPEKAFENLVFLSPERGMLLRYLIESGVKLNEGVLDGADFTYSDLRGFRAENPFYSNFDVQQKISNPERFMCFWGNQTGSSNTLNLGFKLENSDFSGAIISGLTFDPTNVILSDVTISHSVLEKTIDDQGPYHLDIQRASLYDVRLEYFSAPMVKIQLKNVEWHAFDRSCLVGFESYDRFLSFFELGEFELQLSGLVRIFPIEVFSDGMWNGAVEDVSSAMDSKDFSRWIPKVLVDFFSANGIEMTVVGLPGDYEVGDAVNVPEAFGFGLSQ